MGLLTQTKVTPLPSEINLQRKTIIVTGASAGLGLEAVSQLLVLNASMVILAVRTFSKGESCKASLLANPASKENNSNPIVKVIELDMDDYKSVQSFAEIVRSDCPIVDHVLLNAVIASLKHGYSVSAHERTLQVNYLSNVLLLFELIPHLEASGAKTCNPPVITWVSSRMHLKSSLSDQKKAVKPDETVLSHFDDPKNFLLFQKYSYTKLLCLMFISQLASRVRESKDFDKYGASRDGRYWHERLLPLYLRLPINAIKTIRVRLIEEVAWLSLNAMLVEGLASHGKFLLDKEIQP